MNIATLCTYLLAIWSGSLNGTWLRTRNYLRRSTIATATFAALQNLSCTETRQGLSEVRQYPILASSGSNLGSSKTPRSSSPKAGSTPRSPARMRTMTALRQHGRTSLHQENNCINHIAGSSIGTKRALQHDRESRAFRGSRRCFVQKSSG